MVGSPKSGGDILLTTSTHYDLDAMLGRKDGLPERMPMGMRTTHVQMVQTPGGTTRPREDPTTIALHSTYEVGRLLGEGGQGRVFSANHARLGRNVAVKLCSHAEGWQMQRFQGEARLTASLSHPNIIPVYDAGEDILVMKLMSGRALDQIIRNASGATGRTEIMEILVDVCQAVEYAHDRGVLHRDLKAANVVSGDYGEVTLIDWGLAVDLVDDHLPETFADLPVSICAGTPACMPPELFLGSHAAVGRPADVFMLGGMLYHALTGRLPYQDTESVVEAFQRATTCDIVPVHEVNPQAPMGLVQLQIRAMSPHPDQRLSVTQLREGLQHWLHQSGNLGRAEQAVELARLLVQRAEMCKRREQEVRTDCYIQALVQYDRALALTEDLPGLEDERNRVQADFIKASVLGGDITLARLLERHRHLPVGGGDTFAAPQTTNRIRRREGTESASRRRTRNLEPG